MFDLSTVIASGIGGVFTGALVTALGYVLPMASRMASIETSIKEIKETLSKPAPSCALHLQIDKQVAVNTERLDKLEKVNREH